MSYIDSLNAVQKKNMDVLIDRMNKRGITNPNTQAGLLSVVAKESQFIPKNESLAYSPKRITEVFRNVPASDVPKLVNNPIALGNYVYGPKYNPDLGNGEGEGYMYRGRGYNQITGKANYKSIGDQIHVDLVKSPDLLNTPENAAEAALVFFTNGLASLKKKNVLAQYNATGFNDFKTPADSLGAMYHINAGVGSSKAKLDADVTGGKAEAKAVLPDILAYVKSKAPQTAADVKTPAQVATEAVKKKPWMTILIAAGVTLTVFIIVNRIIKHKS